MTEPGKKTENTTTGSRDTQDPNTVKPTTTTYAPQERFKLPDTSEQDEDTSIALGGEADELFETRSGKPPTTVGKSLGSDLLDVPAAIDKQGKVNAPVEELEIPPLIGSSKQEDPAKPVVKNAPATAETPPKGDGGKPATPIDATDGVKPLESKTSDSDSPLEDAYLDALYALGTALGVGSFFKILDRVNASSAHGAEAAHEVKPVEGAGENSRIKHQGESFEVKGQSRDGRVILKSITPASSAEKGPGTVDGGTTKPPVAPAFAEITPQNFNPTEGKFGGYTPIKVDGEKYYASKEGVVFQQKDNKLVETAQTRALNLIPEVDYKRATSDRVVQLRATADAPVGPGRFVDAPPEALVMMDKMPPQTGESSKTAEANQKVNEILQPLRDRLKAGENVDQATKETYYEKARDVLLPIANETAKVLGLPIVPREGIKFEVLGPGGHGAFNRLNGDVLINLSETSPVTVIDHELQHKQRTLDMIAANKANPLGFRYALLDSVLADVGQTGSMVTEEGIKKRPIITDPKALNEFKELVKREAAFHLAEEGLLGLDKVPMDEPHISDRLAEVFGGDRDQVLIAAREECEHFAVIEKQSVLSAEKYDSASQGYVKRKAAQFNSQPAEKQNAEGVRAQPETKPSETIFRENPAIKKLVEGVSSNTLGSFARKHPELGPEYQHSRDETGSRKLQASQELKRLRKEMSEIGDTTRLADDPRGRVLIDKLELAIHQQLMIKNYRQGNMAEAKKYAESVFDKMCARPQEHNMTDVLFLFERGLITREQLLESPFAPNASERERSEQRDAARDITAKLAKQGTISGDNLEAPVKDEKSGGLEYKLKTPAIIERGTETEAKIVSLIQLPDGKLVAKYVDNQSAARDGVEKPVIDEFYGDSLLKHLGKKVDVSKLSAEQKVKLVSDFIGQIQTEEFLGDTNKQAVAQSVDGKPSVNSDIQNPESRDLILADKSALADVRPPSLDTVKYADFKGSFDAWYDATRARAESQRLRDSHSKASLDMRTDHVREQMRKDVARMDKEIAAKDKEIERLRKVLDGKAAGLSDHDAAAFERQIAIESLIEQKLAAEDLSRARSTADAAGAGARRQTAIDRQGLQLRALLGPKPEVVDLSINAADNPNAHPNFRLEDISRKRRSAESSVVGPYGLEEQLQTLKSKGSFGQWWNKNKIADLETRIAAAKAEMVRLDTLAASLREGVIADLKPGETVTIGKQGDVRLTEGQFRSKHASITMREDGTLELRDGTGGKPSNTGITGEDGRTLKDFGTYVKRTAGDGKITYEKVSATTPSIVRPGDEIFIGRDPKGSEARYATMKITVPEKKSPAAPGTVGGASGSKTEQVGREPAVGDPVKPGSEKAPGSVPPRTVEKPIAERIESAPGDIKPGLLRLKELGVPGWESLASDILSLQENGQLPTRARHYLDKAGAQRITGADRIEMLSTIISAAKPGTSPAKPVQIVSSGGGTTGDGNKLRDTDLGAPKEPVVQRHDSFGFGTTVGSKAKDLMVRISYTGPDQVTVDKMVPLMEVPPEELRARLNGLTKEKITDMLARGEEELKRTEGEAKFAEQRKALEAKMESLRDLQKIHEGFETARKGGRELEFCKETQARMQGLHGSHPGRTALAIAGKAGLASALLLLFNDLVPDVNLSTPSPSDRINPGSAK